MKKIIGFILTIVIFVALLFLIMPHDVSGAPICTPEDISSIRTKYENGTAAVGIDVSAHQGEINWSEVAKSGVKFAIIRCGYRGLTGGGLYSDKYFKKNIEGALANNIYVGVYIYSTAINEEEAIAEANYCLECVKGYDIKYGISYDFEDFLPDDNRTDNLPLTQIRSNAHAFINTIRNAGYEAVLYGSVSYLKNEWNLSEFDVPIWAAHYKVSSANFTGHSIWQCSDAGVVPGIKGYADVDIDYEYYFRYNNIDIEGYMFDSEWYAAANPDVRAVYGTDKTVLKNHYETFGKKEGRSPTPFFDPKFYYNKYPDLQKAFGTNYVKLLNHYIESGAKEGRQGSKYFNPSYYIENNYDVKKTYYSSNTKSLEHYILNGIKEGRQGSADFNCLEFKQTLSNYYTSRIKNNYKLYMAHDKGKAAIDNPPIDISKYMFDSEWYLAANPDVRQTYGNTQDVAIWHYKNFGQKEGRSPTLFFDAKFYYNKYPDLQKAFGTNYVALYNHYVSNGAKEGRQGSKYFNPKFYVDLYKDVYNVYDKNYTKVLEHFLLNGLNERRQGSEEFNISQYIESVNSFNSSRIKNNNKLYMALDKGGSVFDNGNISIEAYMFDANYYYNKYPDLQKAIGNNAEALRTHYYAFGIKEGRSGSPIFDPKYYVKNYKDLENAFGTNYESLYNHFVNNGCKEGRNTTEAFHVKEYLNNYKDLESAFGNNYTKLFEHYYLFGYKEGRNGVIN